MLIVLKESVVKAKLAVFSASQTKIVKKKTAPFVWEAAAYSVRQVMNVLAQEKVSKLAVKGHRNVEATEPGHLVKVSLCVPLVRSALKESVSLTVPKRPANSMKPNVSLQDNKCREPSGLV